MAGSLNSRKYKGIDLACVLDGLYWRRELLEFVGRVGKVMPRSTFPAQDNIAVDTSISYSHIVSARGIAPTWLKSYCVRILCQYGNNDTENSTWSLPSNRTKRSRSAIFNMIIERSYI
jgi:hypothetical protein